MNNSSNNPTTNLNSSGNCSPPPIKLSMRFVTWHTKYSHSVLSTHHLLVLQAWLGFLFSLYASVSLPVKPLILLCILWGLNIKIRVKHLEWWLLHTKYTFNITTVIIVCRLGLLELWSKDLQASTELLEVLSQSLRKCALNDIFFLNHSIFSYT